MGAISEQKRYTYKDIEALEEDIRAELIDGQIFFMASPSRLHQRISTALAAEIYYHIKMHAGKCSVYAAPFAVFLFGENDDQNYLEPDISVICDPEKLTDRGCNGAPDFIVEIVSPKTASRDYLYKLNRYQDAGVREYWIINPDSQSINVFDFEGDASNAYRFSDSVSSHVLKGFSVCLHDLLA